MTFWNCPSSPCAVFDSARASDSAGPFLLLISQTFPVGVSACPAYCSESDGKENEIAAIGAVTRESDMDQIPEVTVVWRGK